jgi:hypothetical protein
MYDHLTRLDEMDRMDWDDPRPVRMSDLRACPKCQGQGCDLCGYNGTITQLEYIEWHAEEYRDGDEGLPL